MNNTMNQVQGGTRSRLGCLTCRRRHKKCDERKPACQACQKTGRKCEYGVELKWATIGDSTSVANIYQKKRKRASKPGETLIPCQFHDAGEQARLAQPPSSDLVGPGSLVLNAEPEAPFPSQADDFNFGILIPNALELSSWEADIFNHESMTLTNQQFELDTQAEQILSFDEGEQEPLHFIETQTHHEVSVMSSPPMGMENSGLSLFLSSTISCPSEEMAFIYYVHNETVRIPAYDGRQNPYRRLSAIALSYPLLLQTIVHVSTVSMFNHGKSTGEMIVKHQSQAWNSLQDAFSSLEAESETHRDESRSSNLSLSILSAKEVTLAAFLMFIASEVMSGSHNAETYLRSAYKIIDSLGYVERMPEAFYSRFLVERFAIIDIVLSFLRHQQPIAPPSFVLYQPNQEADDMEPPFRELTGCPQAVLVFLAKISYFASAVVTRENMTLPSLEEAYELETELRVWGQRNFDTFSTRFDKNACLEGVACPAEEARKHLDTLSECFYWTALLLLMRRVFSDATKSARVQFVRKRLFVLMDRLPLGCGPDSSLPFPFYMAAREAIEDKDREWVRQRHLGMMHFYRDKARQIMMELTEEIWLRADEEITRGSQDWTAGFGERGSDMDIHVLDARASHLVF